LWEVKAAVPLACSGIAAPEIKIPSISILNLNRILHASHHQFDPGNT
jgi:hypothetical protein